MFVTTVVVTSLLILVLVASGAGKVFRHPVPVASLRTVGVKDSQFAWLAAAEFAGSAGLFLGLIWWPIGVAAGIGVCLYFVGAICAHARVSDFKNIGTPGVILAFAVAALALRLLTR